MVYVLSQIVIALSYISYGTSYLTKNRKVLLGTTFLSSFLFMIAYILLDAKSAVYINVFSMIRQLLLIIQEKNKSERMYVYIFFFNVISTILIGVFTYENMYSVLPVLATLIFVYSSWQKDIAMYRLCGIFIEVNWLAYGIYLKSIVSIITETILVIAVTYNYIKINKEVETNSSSVVKK